MGWGRKPCDGYEAFFISFTQIVFVSFSCLFISDYIHHLLRLSFADLAAYHPIPQSSRKVNKASSWKIAKKQLSLMPYLPSWVLLNKKKMRCEGIIAGNVAHQWIRARKVRKCCHDSNARRKHLNVIFLEGMESRCSLKGSGQFGTSCKHKWCFGLMKNDFKSKHASANNNLRCKFQNEAHFAISES